MALTLHWAEKATRTIPLGDLRVTLVPGRNTLQMLIKSSGRDISPEELIELMRQSPILARHKMLNRLRVEEDPIRLSPSPPPVDKAGKWAERVGETSARLQEALTPGTEAHTDVVTPKKPEGDKEPEKAKTEPLPWSTRDKVDALREALQSRGLSSEGMTRDDLLTALKVWDDQGAEGA